MAPIVRHQPLYGCGRRGTALIAWVFGRLKVHGRENVPAEGPLIVVSNHMSHLDPPLVAHAVKRRYIYFMAKQELFETPFVGWYLRKIGSFAVRRGAADRNAIRRALEILAAGQAIGMFPEGHRSEDGRLQVAEDGAGLIALRSRAPVLPLGFTGTNSVLPPHAKGFSFGRVAIRIGKPITFDDLYDQPGRAPITEATTRMMAAISELLPPEHLPVE